MSRFVNTAELLALHFSPSLPMKKDGRERSGRWRRPRAVWAIGGRGGSSLASGNRKKNHKRVVVNNREVKDGTAKIID